MTTFCTPTTHAFAMDPIADLDAYAISQLIDKREISHTELIQYFIARIDHLNPQLNAVVHRNNDLALATAHRLDRDSKSCKSGLTLQGIPILIKDNINVAGMPTGHGSQSVTGSHMRDTDPFAQQLLNLDMNCLGKTSLPEFGLNATTEPLHQAPTRNPWNINHSSGGSSGGAAAAVASGMVPIAHGNDGGGSIRIPASCCGVVGLKPSNGRLIASHLGKDLPIKIINDGVITRSVRDTALFYSLAERHYRSPRLPKLGHITEPLSRRLKIGYMIDSITEAPTDHCNRQVLEKTVQLLKELGHSVTPVGLVEDKKFIRNFTHYWEFLAFSLHHFGSRLLNQEHDNTKLEPLTLWLSNKFASTWYRFPVTLYQLHKAKQQYRQVFQQFDLVLTPTLAQEPAILGQFTSNHEPADLMDRLINYASFTALNNVSGAPGMSLPLGISHLGLPIGMHFSADIGDEKTLIELAYELEQTDLWQHIAKPRTQQQQNKSEHQNNAEI